MVWLGSTLAVLHGLRAPANPRSGAIARFAGGANVLLAALAVTARIMSSGSVGLGGIDLGVLTLVGAAMMASAGAYGIIRSFGAPPPGPEDAAAARSTSLRAVIAALALAVLSVGSIALLGALTE